MANIRVDQSHCNYHLGRWLEINGWEICFKDAGRHSRGGQGHQGIILKIFEETGLPIPDLVACKDNYLFLIEIDRSINKALKSLESYGSRSELILLMAKRKLKNEKLNILKVGFCKTGTTRDPRKAIESISKYHNLLDTFILFLGPREPLVSQIGKSIA